MGRSLRGAALGDAGRSLRGAACGPRSERAWVSAHMVTWGGLGNGACRTVCVRAQWHNPSWVHGRGALGGELAVAAVVPAMVSALRPCIYQHWRFFERTQGLNPGKAINKIKQSLAKGSPV